MLRLLRSWRKSLKIIKLRALRSHILGNTLFEVQSAHKPATDEIREEIAQMRIELGLVLKHVTGCRKVYAVNYLSKPPQPTDEYYYEEDSYALNDQTGGFQPNAKASIRRIGAKVK